MSMTKYECAVDSFKSQDYVDEPILEALRAGQEAIELIRMLTQASSDAEFEYLDVWARTLLKEWD